ncbi:hypothetical protein GGI19_002192 [Coemansia pectinata]|uniref:Uncharacterized protein n=1 Tax=Coemansia pectinata TaxID=1052879 RepID=A0A9W8GW76_9FUNG|nr:hypothetical protein GGI19_002192 [Coemansia pectinata]
MGISAIFKRPKATSSSSQASTDDSIKDGQRPRHIKRRPTASGNRSSEDRMNPAAPAPKVSKGAARIISRTSSTSDIGELPTPESSLNEGPGASRTRSSATKSMAAPITLPARSQTDSDMFGLYRLTTPPLDSATPQLREIDPFEDSPPPRPLTDFEDPVYIPPLTLAATLVDDYGTMGGVAQVGSNSATNAATLATTSVRATASTFARSSTTTATGSLDLLSEFNASYNYLFGTLPSDSALAANAFDSGASNSLDRPSAKSSAAVTATPSRPNAKYARVADTGMLSPVSVQTVGSGGSNASVPDESANEDDAISQDSSSPSEDIELIRELEEERRKEEERKAAEQRNRRRELIKQQVAFERMKERHRRQYPSQQQPASAHNSVARWQKESASAVAPPPQQQAMYASNGAINRGYAQAMPPHQPHVAPHGNNNGSASYANLPTSASMSNIAYMAESQNTGLASAQFATLPRHKNQGFPLIADTFAARTGQTVLQHSGEHHSASFSGYIPTNGYQMQQQPLQPLQLQPPVPSAHPVKLASMPQRAKNPYLSDSSDDGGSNATDEADSDDMTSIGSSDISCDPPLEQREPDTVPLGINGGSIRAPRSVSQPIMSVGGSDTSSDTSAKSQSSSTRRVRFHETVSVVFNTRHTVAGEDFEEPDALESDNDSSNASIDLNATSTSGANSGLCLVGGSSDEAFDGSNAYSHSRYQIPPTFIPTQSDSVAQWYDEESTTVANSKDTSGYSSRNISPDGTKRHNQRPKHRIETQPLRDREAERELRKKAQGGRIASQQPTQRPRPTPPPKQVQVADPAPSDPQPPPAPAPVPPVTEVASDSQKPSVDRMAEARRALLGHYNVPNPELPIGKSIPRSGTATTTSFARTSSVKILQPPSFARPKQRPAASNPQLNIRSVSEHKPMERKPQSETTTYATQPQRQASATAKDSSSTDINYALRNSLISSFGASTKVKPDDGDNSDGDDVPLSTFARSRSEPMSNLPRRSTDDYLSRQVAANNNYDSDSNAIAAEKGAAKSTNPRRFFGRNQADVAGNPISRSNTLSSVSAPKVEDHVATFEQMRSLSMDVAPRQSTEKRRFGRWGNFF